jgi:hypothetical protein
MSLSRWKQFRFSLAIVTFSISAVCAATAQKYTYPYGVEAQGVAGAVGVDTLADQSPENRSAADIKAALRILDGTNVTKLAFFVSGYKNFMRAIENDRNDVQMGSPPSTSGTTSVVSKGVAAQVLSLATENGALSRTDNKTVSTFRGNPVGIARLLKGDEAFPYCAIYDFGCESGLARVLDGASFSVSFNTTPSNGASSATSTTTTDNSRILNASSRQVAAWGVRYDFHVRKKPADIAKDYGKQFNDTVRKSGAAYAQAVQALLKKIPEEQLATWEAKYVTVLQSDATADRGSFTKALSQAVSDLADLAQRADPQFKAASDLVITKMSSYFVSRDKLLADYVNKMTFSISYDDTLPANQPNESSVKLILSARPRVAQITGNATVEWYDQILKSNVSRLRDAQLALECDHTFGKTDAQVNPSLSAGYYFQYMVDNALLTLPSTALAPGTSIPLPGNASELLNTKGSIHLGQVKVTFKVRNSGISIPLALTFSNRSDLIKATDVRGNFGLTYNLDSLFTK